MNIMDEIIKLKNTFIMFNNEEPNCVKLGKDDILQLEEWYNEISKPESENKKVKINNGSQIMGLHIIKMKDKKYLEVDKIDSIQIDMAIPNPYCVAKIEVKNGEN